MVCGLPWNFICGFLASKEHIKITIKEVGAVHMLWHMQADSTDFLKGLFICNWNRALEATSMPEISVIPWCHLPWGFVCILSHNLVVLAGQSASRWEPGDTCHHQWLALLSCPGTAGWLKSKLCQTGPSSKWCYFSREELPLSHCMLWSGVVCTCGCFCWHCGNCWIGHIEALEVFTAHLAQFPKHHI